MRIVTVAMDTVWKDAKKNVLLTEKHVTEVLHKYPRVDVILFPEISLMGTLDDNSAADIAETLDGYCVAEVKRIAKHHNVALICSIIEQNPSGKPYNTTFAISSTGDFLTYYRKNHLHTGSDIDTPEPEIYAAGEELATFELAGWKCGLATCFDLRFPRLFAAYKQAGVELVFVPNNWIQGRNKPAILEHLVKARAHENQYFVVAVDRTGADPTASYHGISVFSNPYSEDVATRDGIYSYAEISKDDIETLGQTLPLSESFKKDYTIG